MAQYSVSPIITATSDMDNYGLNGYSYFPTDCSAGNITITLPTSVWDGLCYIFNRTDSSTNVLTLDAHTGTVAGGSSITIGPKTYVEAVFLNGDWMIPRITYT